MCYHAVNTPTILVINKLDLLKKDQDFRKSFYRVIEKLTCGHLNGEPSRGDRVNENPSSLDTVDRYLKRKLKVSEVFLIQGLKQYYLYFSNFVTGTKERFKRAIQRKGRSENKFIS